MSGRVIVLLEKEWIELSRHRTMLATILLPPIIFLLLPFGLALLLPALVGQHAFDDPDLKPAFHALQQQIPENLSLSIKEVFQVLMFRQFLLFFLLIPVVSAMSITAYSIVGEKVSRSLEPLLATPITTAELLWGKCLAAVIPTMVLSWLSFGLYALGIILTTSPIVFQLVINLTALCLIFLLTPAIGVLALSLCLITSSRATDPRSAQQISVVVILPLIGLFVTQLRGVLLLTPTAVVTGVAFLAIIDILILRIGANLFERETILTRWK